jgi:RNA polymerase sigma factor (sigma-70 family)
MAVAPLHDPAAEFEGLYREYAPRVYRYALAVLRNPADAEDVTQTTFMNAYRAMQNGTEPEKPENWLLRIAHNACRTRFIRAANRPREVPLDETVHDIPLPEEEKPNVREVLKALGRLPFNQRSALVMRELEGRTYEEIAEALGVSVAAVETLLFRARRSLKLRRATIRSLGAVQLPASLQSFFSGGAAVTSGTLVGSGAVVKAVALLTAAVTATGAGYQAVKAASARPATQRPAAHVVSPEGDAPATRAPVGHARMRAAAGSADAPAAAVRKTKPSAGHGAAGAPAANDSPAAGTPSAAAPGTPDSRSAGTPGTPGAPPATAPAPTPAPVPVPVDVPAPLPPAPQVPPPPVNVPAVPAPQLPAPPPVAVPPVPTPPLPEAPLLPKLP